MGAPQNDEYYSLVRVVYISQLRAIERFSFHSLHPKVVGVNATLSFQPLYLSSLLL